MKIDMSIDDNFASFTDDDGVMVFIDSFDNKSFDVRIGTIDASEPVGTIIANSKSELNTGIKKLYIKYKGQ